MIFRTAFILYFLAIKWRMFREGVNIFPEIFNIQLELSVFQIRGEIMPDLQEEGGDEQVPFCPTRIPLGFLCQQRLLNYSTDAV